MKQPLDFTFNRHTYHAGVDVSDDYTFDVLEFYRWDYKPNDEPFSVDVIPRPFRNIIGRELDKHIASQLMEDWITQTCPTYASDFADQEINECEYYKDELCFHVDFIPFGRCGRLCQLSVYRYDPLTDSWRKSKHLDPARKKSLEQAFKDVLYERYQEIDEEEESRRQELAEAYERDYHSEYCREDVEERHRAQPA